MEASLLKGKQEQEENDDGEWNGGRNVAVEEGDTFDIPPKGASIERLRRWRQAVLVLNASRRFRYTLDLKQEEGNERIRRKIRAHAQVIRAAFLFQEAGERHIPKTELPGTLSTYEEVKGVANLLKTNIDKGITGDDADLVSRRNAFGSNTYPHKKGKCFWVFLWEACQDLTLIILMVAAALSLALGIKTEGIKEGWYDGGSIAFAVFLVIVVTATSDYKQSLQFKHLNEEMQNIHVEVIGSGKRLSVSIFDLVVGDAVPLKIGDQVPADGLLISGQSLAIDESSMTGESKIVRKDQKSPFLMSGCKVADGYGTMLLTAVGMNTEWGLLMATISEDNGEETPLQELDTLILALSDRYIFKKETIVEMVGLAVAGAVLVVLMARYFTGKTTNADGTVQYIKGQTSAKSAIDGVIKFFTVAVTIVVVAVPEGLPLAVTLTLAYSMRKMMTDKALVTVLQYVLVRRLSACETMGQLQPYVVIRLAL
ncbi:Calcium-transporting ATPase [Rhynchospora pubera]|uniref:Calcium-transporting ATPase n=1 Tax=Rhynchospora pubera TaxID=906938 RepID=A0AAV8AQP4_9POAL|nr:Calcium-transporting ATPase [Rhynchospora pubera]